MSSVIKKFIIEEYVNGGYGLFNLLDKSEIMGINKSDLLIEIIKELERTENEHDEHCLDYNTDKEIFIKDGDGKVNFDGYTLDKFSYNLAITNIQKKLCKNCNLDYKYYTSQDSKYPFNCKEWVTLEELKII